MEFQIIQRKIMQQQRAGDMLRTRVHLLLQLQRTPNRYLVKATIESELYDSNVKKISWEIDNNIYKTMWFSRGIDVQRKNKQALDKFITDYLYQMVNDDRN